MGFQKIYFDILKNTKLVGYRYSIILNSIYTDLDVKMEHEYIQC